MEARGSGKQICVFAVAYPDCQAGNGEGNWRRERGRRKWKREDDRWGKTELESHSDRQVVVDRQPERDGEREESV